MKNIIEITPFYLKTDSNIENFLNSSDLFQQVFLSLQKGFISRQLLLNDDQWSDLILWETIEDARNAFNQIYHSEAASSYIQFIDEARSSDDDIKYYSVKKSYSLNMT